MGKVHSKFLLIHRLGIGAFRPGWVRFYEMVVGLIFALRTPKCAYNLNRPARQILFPRALNQKGNLLGHFSPKRKVHFLLGLMILPIVPIRKRGWGVL